MSGSAQCGIRGPNVAGEWNLFFFAANDAGIKLSGSLTNQELVILRNAIDEHLRKQAERHGV